VTVEVDCSSPGAYRALFARLKFLRLLHTIAARDGGGYTIEIDGPFSLFDAVTRYGLQLALALPVISACRRWSLEAEVRWGKDRTAARFRLQGEPAARDSIELAGEPLSDEL